jgi:phosphohistidine phosphatase
MMAVMKVYVMRHGPAEDDSPTGRDADRALTTSGRDRTRSVAKALVDGGEGPVQIISSPLVRALQTAEIVAAAAGIDQVEVRREIAPGGDSVALIAELVRAGKRRVMLVGHEPDLSMLVHRLVGKAPEQGMLKAMVVGVRCEVDAQDQRGFSSKLRFVLDPKTLGWQRE